MNNKLKLPLPKDKKLEVFFRVESGCLGPQGEEHVNDFCTSAQKEVDVIDADFVHWNIIPRHDKKLPEMEYKLNNKKLTHDKAAKYLSFFDKNLDEFEGHLHDKLALLIDEYLGH
ncbi:MAG: hypothetical protein DIZ80_10500 [endosymbiont of Galathealinum brachiosum]|uniref:Uncharacterized protein n=1 Tax=endosymbiont of Galathealinum brachiosum TaxID=2200906 RepID=A0A370DCU4_9GAMM|nr:MAG: hypothetical protein DIZ80_10500 [endosymbiont of Galathealinum brachiosum]